MAEKDKKKVKKRVQKNVIREYAESIGIAIIAALIIRALFIQAFRIPTGSMENTLLVGDFLLVNKFIYGARIPFTDWRLPAIREPKPGDIIVFKYPLDPDLDYIKRCIAVEGQTIEIKDKKIYVDGKLHENPEYVQFIDSHIMRKGIPEPNIYPPGTNFNRDNYGPFVIPDGHLFMMGDNRDNSLDSRYWGILPKENVVGSALIIYWSWDHNIPLYKFFTKVRWSRIADLIK
ncbi:MAG: signal peptidase I [bacterium]|nr:signal peptidase I [bacterium]